MHAVDEDVHHAGGVQVWAVEGGVVLDAGKYVSDLLGESVHKRYADLKLASAERCPKALGALIKIPEIQFHHEVTNQYLWSKF